MLLQSGQWRVPVPSRRRCSCKRTVSGALNHQRRHRLSRSTPPWSATRLTANARCSRFSRVLYRHACRAWMIPSHMAHHEATRTLIRGSCGLSGTEPADATVSVGSCSRSNTPACNCEPPHTHQQRKGRGTHVNPAANSVCLATPGWRSAPPKAASPRAHAPTGSAHQASAWPESSSV